MSQVHVLGCRSERKGVDLAKLVAQARGDPALLIERRERNREIKHLSVGDRGIERTLDHGRN